MRAPARRRSSAYAQQASPSVSLLRSSVFLNGPAVRRRPQRQDASRRDRLAIGGLPSPGTGAVASLRHPFLVDLGNDVAIAGEQRLGRAHLGAQWQLAFGQPVGAVLLELFLAAVGIGAAGAERALVHLAARPEVTDLRILRRTERASVEAVAAPDAEIFRVQHHGVRRGVEAVHGAYRRAGRVGAVHAGHGDRPLARLAVIESDDAPAVDAPGHFVFVLAGRDAGVALDAAVGVAEEFHSRHGRSSLRCSNLTEGDLRLLHARRRVIAVGGDRVRAFAKHDRVGARRVVSPQVLATEPATEVERHPGNALADTLGDQRLHLGLGAVFSTGDPNPAAVLDSALGRIGRIDLYKHVLLQFGEPLVGSRLFTATFVFDQ